MEEIIKECGLIIKCREMGNINGQIEEYIKVF